MGTEREQMLLWRRTVDTYTCFNAIATGLRGKASIYTSASLRDRHNHPHSDSFSDEIEERICDALALPQPSSAENQFYFERSFFFFWCAYSSGTLRIWYKTHLPSDSMWDQTTDRREKKLQDTVEERSVWRYWTCWLCPCSPILSLGLISCF